MGVLVNRIQKYKGFIEEEVAQPILMDKLVALFKEMSNIERKEMAIQLHLPSVHTSKNMPAVLFIKEIYKYLKPSDDHFNRKYSLLMAVIRQLLEILDDEDEHSLISFLKRRESIVAAHGYWHYYWSLYFHPSRTKQSAMWEQAMSEVKLDIPNYPSLSPTLYKQQPEPNIVTKRGEETEQASELEKQCAAIKKKLNKEIQLRKQAETSLGKLEQKVYRLTQSLADLETYLQQSKQKLICTQQLQEKHVRELESQLMKNNMIIINFEAEQRKWKQEEEYLQQQLIDKEQQIEVYQCDRHKCEEHIALLEKQLTASHTKVDHLSNQNTLWKNMILSARPNTLIASIKYTIHFLYDHIQHKLGMNEHPMMTPIEEYYHRQMTQADRQKMRENLALIDQLELFIQDRTELVASKGKDNEVVAGNKEADFVEQNLIIHEESACSAESNMSVLEHEAKSDTNGFLGQADHIVDQRPAAEEHSMVNGTFYRRDHGGYIVLEDGQTFNITESLVLQRNLQHEAGVLCTPKLGEQNQYEIELLFQGDDSNSPIVQYDGYIQLGEHFMWYCVNLNDPAQRFSLHERDVAIRVPKDGDPCSFNVEIGKQVARLSRLYRTQSDLELKQTMLAATSARTGEKTQTKKEQPKPEPFLAGHQITIVGGLKKWFEEVVVETGAMLVHENGRNPKRVFHDLKRSSALFLLLTATSHQAYWDCIDIAKQYQIPFYFIEGSKSNLRLLLHQNREQIVTQAT